MTVLPSNASFQGAIEACERMAGLPLTGGNRVELLVNGRRTFDEIFSAIDRAEAYRMFRGRDPRVEALLKNRGFPTDGN